MNTTIPGTSGFDSRWLAYARDVLTDAEHRANCVTSGGARPTQDDPHATLRWPGYIGEGYARILCLGIVHNGDMLYAGRRTGQPPRRDPLDLAKSVLDLEPVAIDWRAGSAGDQEYMAQVRTTYSRALPYWDTWKRIMPILKHFGYKEAIDAVDHIAYANIAKCWSDTSDKKRSDDKVMACCNRWAKGSKLALIKAIKPVCILAATWNPGFTSADLPMLADGHPADLWRYHYLHGTIHIDDKRHLRDEWAPIAAEKYLGRINSA